MDRRRLFKEVLAGVTLCGIEAFLLYGHGSIGSSIAVKGLATQKAQAVKYARVTKLSSIQSSQNWAGYVVSSGVYHSVSATWKVPDLTSAGGVAAQWVGLGGVNSQDLLQTGTIEQQTGGATTAQVFVEELPQHAQNIMTVPIGSTIAASIAPVTGTEWDLQVTATYQGKTQSKTVPMTVSSGYVQGMESSAEWIFEDPASTSGNLYPLGMTGNVTFSNVQANSQAVRAANALVMTGPGGQSEVEPSVMKDGSFTTKEVSGGQSYPSPSQGFPYSVFPQSGYGNGGGNGYGGYGAGGGYGGYGARGGYGGNGDGYGGYGGGNGYGSGLPGYSFPPVPVIIQVPVGPVSPGPLPFSINL